MKFPYLFFFMLICVTTQAQPVDVIPQDSYEYQLLPFPNTSETFQSRVLKNTPNGSIEQRIPLTAGQPKSYIHLAPNGQKLMVAYNIQTQQYVAVSNTLRIHLAKHNDLAALISDYGLTLHHQFPPRALAFVTVASPQILPNTYRRLANDHRVQRVSFDFQNAQAITD